MSKFRVALLQLRPPASLAESLERGVAACRRARLLGADLVLFPELWNIGYQFPPEASLESFDLDNPKCRAMVEQWCAGAISADSGFVRAFEDLAKEIQLAIVVTYLESFPGGPRDSATLIDSTGRRILHYSKVQTCDFYFETACTPGQDFPVATLETREGPVRVGVMICFDREFPEPARVLMLSGAEIILVPNACEMERHRLSQLSTRAFENMVGVALANYCGPAWNGSSVAFSPVVFDGAGQSVENTIIHAGDEEGIYIAEFDMTAIRAYRDRECWGAKYRKPGTYGRLLRE
ncbi:MAG: carbon-nitrogen hydrolase family protein [Alphaproteobacteria bacterium]|nr:carbon-nitrogen hydrolase family protein [Alphaproteobacteria bacterium]